MRSTAADNAASHCPLCLQRDVLLTEKRRTYQQHGNLIQYSGLCDCFLYSSCTVIVPVTLQCGLIGLKYCFNFVILCYIHYIYSAYLGMTDTSL